MVIPLSRNGAKRIYKRQKTSAYQFNPCGKNLKY